MMLMFCLHVCEKCIPYINVCFYVTLDCFKVMLIMTSLQSAMCSAVLYLTMSLIIIIFNKLLLSLLLV